MCWIALILSAIALVFAILLKDQSDSGENERDPAHPAPAKILSDEPSNNRADDYIWRSLSGVLAHSMDQVCSSPIIFFPAQ
jgi:hypothetical protein